MEKVRVAVVGIGNCASSLIQGIHYYQDGPDEDARRGVGLLHPEIQGYGPGDIEVVAAVDIDARKVGRPLHEAVFALPNNTKAFYSDFRYDNVIVAMGNVLDGVADHMQHYPEHQRFVVADRPNAAVKDIVKLLRESGAEILMNYVPVGSQKATEFYAECCLQTGVSLINCIPVFIVSDPAWGRRFTQAGIPCVGDDVKAQLGATIVHRVLTWLFKERGAEITATYQLNTGGNTDFLNMLNQSRLQSKRISKTEAVQSQLDVPLPDDQVHIGPADFVPWQKDNKICFCRIEGKGFGGVPLNIELRLSVEDSPNSAGETIDAIRCCKLARERGLAGPLVGVSAFTMKHPPVQFTDYEAMRMLEEFIAAEGQPAPERYQPAKREKQPTPAK
ncbi:MAG: inositol-3-phosphate synthase [Phycisphaerae bacterium SM23_33]|nr:MAG: inositol-3-phosphate synthase [Phycisphaerae bacterium SM23_33]